MLIISLIVITSCFYQYFKGQWGIYQFDLKQTLPLRGFLVLLVISCHLAPHFGKSFLSSDLGVMGAPSVSCFFFLSGYGLLKSIKQKGEKYLDSFLRKRIGKLLIPLIIITILFILLQTTTKGFNANYFYTRLLQGNGTTPYSWFIFAIIACYILFYNSFYKRNNLQISIIINTFLIIVLIFITYKLEWHIWTISLISFPLGLYTSLYEYHIEKLIKTHHLLLILVICAICFYCNYSLYVNKLPIWWPIFSNIFPLMTYCVLRGISISNIKLLNWIGKYSYEIYLIHGTLIYFTQDYINNPHTLSMIIILGTLLLAPIIKKIAIIIYSQ